jgi:hypothetical protein
MWGFNAAVGKATWPSFYSYTLPPFDTWVDSEIRQLNTTAAGYGFKDWKVPSRSELDAFLSRGPADTTGKDFLLSLDPDWKRQDLASDLSTAPYIWTTQAPASPVVCTGLLPGLAMFVKAFTDYVHTVAGPVTSSLSGYPAQYGNHNRPDVSSAGINIGLASDPQTAYQNCVSALSARVNDYFASESPTMFATLLATRSTGNVNYLP